MSAGESLQTTIDNPFAQYPEFIDPGEQVIEESIYFEAEAKLPGCPLAVTYTVIQTIPEWSPEAVVEDDFAGTRVQVTEQYSQTTLETKFAIDAHELVKQQRWFRHDHDGRVIKFYKFPHMLHQRDPHRGAPLYHAAAESLIAAIHTGRPIEPQPTTG
ncbi:MAG TPA: hypothetical protein VMT96_00045 [Candidatus Bathyarchaeia archaeon]|nr:hypothetical protein [Candidatus Bathyarchaeia archaeon]